MEKRQLGSKVLQPYAEAIFDLAKKNNLLDEIKVDLYSLITLIKSSNELKELFFSPVIKRSVKKALLTDFVNKLNFKPETTKFLYLLVDRNRFIYIENIFYRYELLIYKFRKIDIVDIVTAVEFSPAQQDELKSIIKAKINSNDVELNFSFNKELIAGFIISINSQVIDMSFLGQVYRLKERLFT
uniref:ATP synthase CF1 delta subunit n=1 Tax=Gloeochaete wittrockiana TaxID=38269 RepID=A0A3G1IVW0_9EUKA|nr:ATP synthase CF1 delta subunit [Gloeochaete wittrockiana]ASQ40180.1 ATP synthase CF1 delta subunit [Gloeochaete wittrockiana]